MNNTRCVWTPICFVGYAKIGLLDVVDREDATLTYNNATNCVIEHYASYGHHALYIGGGINTKSVIEGGLEVQGGFQISASTLVAEGSSQASATVIGDLS